jgi:TctA family transporter
LETNLFTTVDAKIAVTGICKQVSGTNTWHGRQDFAAASGAVGSCILAVAFFVLFRSRLFLLTYSRQALYCFILLLLLLSSFSSSKKQQKRSQKLNGFGLIAVCPIFDFSLIDEEISLDEESCMKISCNL